MLLDFKSLMPHTSLLCVIYFTVIVYAVGFQIALVPYVPVTCLDFVHSRVMFVTVMLCWVLIAYKSRLWDVMSCYFIVYMSMYFYSFANACFLGRPRGLYLLCFVVVFMFLLLCIVVTRHSP